MGCRPTRFDPYVWIRARKVGYNYTGTHNDDVLVVAVSPISSFIKLKETYEIKTFGPSKANLGCDYSQVKKGATTWWVTGSSTYTAKAFIKVYALLKVVILWKEKLHSSTGDHPELDSSPLMSEKKHRIYQQLVGILEWMV